MNQNSFLAYSSYCSNEDKAKIYPRKVTIVYRYIFVGKELHGMERLISVNSYELIKMNRKECFLAYCSKLDIEMHFRQVTFIS